MNREVFLCADARDSANKMIRASESPPFNIQNLKFNICLICREAFCAGARDSANKMIRTSESPPFNIQNLKFNIPSYFPVIQSVQK